MGLLFREPVQVGGEGNYPLTAHYVRVEITTWPDYLTHGTGAHARYRGIGFIGETVDGDLQHAESLQYLMALYGPFDDKVNGLYLQLADGVAATYEEGYELNDEVQPSAQVALTTSQALANATGVVISWQALTGGIGQLWSAALPSRLIATEPGLYLFSWVLGLPTATYTDLRVVLQKNGANLVNLFWQQPGAVPAGGFAASGSYQIALAAADFLGLAVYQTSGASRNADNGTFANLVRLSAL